MNFCGGKHSLLKSYPPEDSNLDGKSKSGEEMAKREERERER